MANPERPLTLMAVHAHPDDEATGTGGVFARYSSEGVRTVLVTCTNGELGDAAGGIKPGEPGHDGAAVAAVRRGELERSCELLGIDHLELLGFHDSGMMGWTANDAPGSFWTTPVEVGASRLAELIEQYRPQVVVTYDANGFYGHPDHIQAHRITTAAVERTGIAEKLYHTAVPRSALPEFAKALAAAGVEPPEPLESDPEFGTPDELITTIVDCSVFVETKFAALSAHATQAENTFFLNMGKPLFAQLFGTETFVRAIDRTNAAVPEDDLFAGLR
jgi:LmbE family N-acetylglucosaminyl deacetylase